jgi:hypothetical protein
MATFWAWAASGRITARAASRTVDFSFMVDVAFRGTRVVRNRNDGKEERGREARRRIDVRHT